MAETRAPGAGGVKASATSHDSNPSQTAKSPVLEHCFSEYGGAGNSAQTTDMNRLLRSAAGRVIARLPKGSGIEIADLIQAGNIGLLQAQRTFRPENGVSLAGYAKFRIRGEMLDTVRRSRGPVSAYAGRPGDTAEDPGDREAGIPAPAEQSPHLVVAENQRATILGQEIERLPARYRTLVRLRYSGECSLREIGAVLRVHESRACQLHQSALGCLRRALSRRGVRLLSSLM
jgi:RNA polymerase sigma factor FliA